MSILKKLFGNSAPKHDNQEFDIDKLIEHEDTNSSIIELDNYIAQFCSYGDEIDNLNDCHKTFFYNQTIEREVNNGGFSQFYFNSSGAFAHEVVASLKSIGAHKTALIVQNANNQFPEKSVPKDQDEREKILGQIEESAYVVWEQLDEKFCNYEEDLNSLNMAYIKKHKQEFI